MAWYHGIAPIKSCFAGGIALAWFFAAVVSCSQQITFNQGEKIMPGKAIATVLKEHTGSLMSLNGVVGTAQGLCAGKPCVKVYVIKKTPDLLKKIPSTLEGYTVEVQETDEIKALDRK